MPAPPPERSAALLVVAGAVADDAAVRALCDRLRAVIATTDAQVIAVDVRDLPATCRSIEALARLALTARRSRRRIRLRRASPALEQLLDFAGLASVLPTAALD